MRVVIQRVLKASVKVNDKETKVKKGFLVFVAFKNTDTPADADYLANKIAKLRIMSDEKGKMNLTLNDVDAEVLVISQFTLYASTRKGSRPSFAQAAEPRKAKELYELFIEKLQDKKILVKTGSFGAYMLVSSVNDGPVTIIIDSSDKEKPRRSKSF